MLVPSLPTLSLSLLPTVIQLIVALELRAHGGDAQERGEERDEGHEYVALRGVCGIGVLEAYYTVDLLGDERTNVWQKSL